MLVCDPAIEHSAIVFVEATASEVVSIELECSELPGALRT